MIDPGKMNDRIVLLKHDTKTISDPVTQEIPYWRVLGTVWCQYRPTGGREFREGSVAVGEERATFTTHWRADLEIVDRLVFGGRIWDVRSINRVGWCEGLDINATSTGETYEDET